MIIKINLNSNSSFSHCDENGTFMTSLEIVQEVMNVPMCALTSLLKANGYKENEELSSFCIDEKRLDIFADAYVRKMRAYFFSSQHNIGKLDFKELKDYIDFVESFKKKGVVKSSSYHWSDIDEDRIKVFFKDIVKKKTPAKAHSLYFDINDIYRILVRKIYSDYENGDTLSYSGHYRGFVGLYNLEFYNLLDGFCNNFISRDLPSTRGEALLASIVQSYYYIAKTAFVKVSKCTVSLISGIVRSARYYIFSSNTDGNHNSVMNNILNISDFYIINHGCCERLCMQTIALKKSYGKKRYN